MLRYPYQPDTVPPPGETIEELLDAHHLSPAVLAAQMGCSEPLLQDLITGQAPLTPEIARQLAAVLGVPARFWRNGEACYRAWLAQSSATAAVY